MRFLTSLFSILVIIGLTSTAMAQSTDIKWKDIASGQRQAILNQWRALPQGEKASFMTYRTQAIQNLTDADKAKYGETAKARVERKKSLEADYKKRVKAEESKARAVIKDIVEPAQITPIDTTPIEMAKPAEIAIPEVATETTAPVDKETATEKAKKMIDKFF